MIWAYGIIGMIWFYFLVGKANDPKYNKTGMPIYLICSIIMSVTWPIICFAILYGVLRESFK